MSTTNPPTDREIVEALAKIVDQDPGAGWTKQWNLEQSYLVWDDGCTGIITFDPLNSLDDVAECEAVIEKRGLWREYGMNLDFLITGDGPGKPPTAEQTYKMITAPARVRALACWAVLKESEGK